MLRITEAYTYSPSSYAASIPQSTYTWNYYFGGAGINPRIAQPYLQEWNVGVQRQIGRSNVLELRYMGHRSVHQWVSLNTNEVNVLENGFLTEFKAAQQNLAINATHGINSFANNGYSGQQGLPIFDAAFAGESSGGTGVPLADYGNQSFINYLNRGAVVRDGSLHLQPRWFLIGAMRRSVCVQFAGPISSELLPGKSFS